MGNRQWGTVTTGKTGSVGSYAYVDFPIAFTKYQMTVANHEGSDAAIIYTLKAEYRLNHVALCAKNHDGTYTTGWILNYISIGI